MAELSAAGTSTVETTSRASTRPSAVRIGNASTAATGVTSRAMNSRACGDRQGLRVVAGDGGCDLLQRRTGPAHSDFTMWILS